MELHALCGNIHCGFRAAELCHCSIHGEGLAAVLCHCSPVKQELGGLYFALHVGNHPLETLECGKRFSELDSFLHVLDGFVERTLSNAESLCCNAYTPAVKGGHCNFEALVKVAEQILFGNNAVFENKFGC